MLLSCSALGCSAAGPVRKGDAEVQATQAKVLAVADAALVAISRGDWPGLADLMLPEGMILPTGEKAGAPVYSVLTREAVRTRKSDKVITERGFAGEARIAGHLATVWLPYDLYIDGKWSHCGVDLFALVERPEGWKIAEVAYTVEQPPLCARHPTGPPPGAQAP
jgi:hypothetical protein